MEDKHESFELALKNARLDCGLTQETLAVLGQDCPDSQITASQTVVNRTCYSSFLCTFLRKEVPNGKQNRTNRNEFYLSDDEQYVLGQNVFWSRKDLMKSP